MELDMILEKVKTPNEIEGIRLYLKNVWAKKRFSFGTWLNRQHLIMAIDAGGCTGYAEGIIGVNQPEISLENYQVWSQTLLEQSIDQAIKKVRQNRGKWTECFTEMAEMALLDLGGKINQISAAEILGLKGTKPVYGVYVILSDDPEDVSEKTKWAVAKGKERFIKVKLFGQNQLDCDIIKMVKKNTKQQTYLIGDVNGGYCLKDEVVSLEEIAGNLIRLKEAGLDACEDPAYIETEQWVKLQSMVGDLSLIPDYPLRPARESIHKIVPGMGRIYNIHPDSTGSIIDAVALAEKVRSCGAGLMIGDDSLVGPAASVWQQLAIGLEAEWVEATEKEGESDFYYQAVVSIPTDSRVNPIKTLPCHGFGLYLNEEILTNNTDRRIEIK